MAKKKKASRKIVVGGQWSETKDLPALRATETPPGMIGFVRTEPEEGKAGEQVMVYQMPNDGPPHEQAAGVHTRTIQVGDDDTSIIALGLCITPTDFEGEGVSITPELASGKWWGLSWMFMHYSESGAGQLMWDLAEQETLRIIVLSNGEPLLVVDGPNALQDLAQSVIADSKGSTEEEAENLVAAVQKTWTPATLWVEAIQGL